MKFKKSKDAAAQQKIILCGLSEASLEPSTLKLKVRGWFLDPGNQKVKILLQGVGLLGEAQTNFPRPDIYRIHPEYNMFNSGWQYQGKLALFPARPLTLDIHFLSNGVPVKKITTIIAISPAKQDVNGLPKEKNQSGDITYKGQNLAVLESSIINKLLFGLAPLNDEDMDRILKSDDYFATGVHARHHRFLELLEQRYRMPMEVMERLIDSEQRNWSSSIKNRTSMGQVRSLRDLILLRLETYKRNREALRRLISLFNIPTRALFDVGFQFGFLLLAAVQEGFGKIAGAEINKGVAGFVNDLKKYIEENYNIDYATYFGDFSNLDINAHGFNLVTCVDVLEHTPDLTKTMGNMQKICSPGGMIYIYQGNGRSLTIATHEPHYQLPGLSLLPRELAIEVMTHLGEITDKTRYLVNEWPQLQEIRQCLVKEDTHFEVYNTDVNIRNNDKYPEVNQLKIYLSKFRHTAEEKLLPLLNDPLKKEVLYYINKYLEEIEKDKSAMKTLDFKKKYLMPSWNIVIRP